LPIDIPVAATRSDVEISGAQPSGAKQWWRVLGERQD
jgi:hypothetical protein